MKYFTINELTRSDTAKAKGIDNTPDATATANMTALIDNLLDPIREMWGAPIYVNSGYRCEALNAAVGGSKTSQHRTGQAADLTLHNAAKNKELFEMIRNSNLPFDQLIDESHYSWVHVSYDKNRDRRQVLHL